MRIIFIIFFITHFAFADVSLSFFSKLRTDDQVLVENFLKTADISFGSELELGKKKRLKLSEVFDFDKLCIVLNCTSEELGHFNSDPKNNLNKILNFSRLNNAISAYEEFLLSPGIVANYKNYDIDWFSRVKNEELFEISKNGIFSENFNYNGFFKNTLKEKELANQGLLSILRNYSMSWDGHSSKIGLFELRNIKPVKGYDEYLDQLKKLKKFFNLEGDFQSKSIHNYSIHTHISSPKFNLSFESLSGELNSEVHSLLKTYQVYLGVEAANQSVKFPKLKKYFSGHSNNMIINSLMNKGFFRVIQNDGDSLTSDARIESRSPEFFLSKKDMIKDLTFLLMNSDEVDFNHKSNFLNKFLNEAISNLPISKLNSNVINSLMRLMYSNESFKKIFLENLSYNQKMSLVEMKNSDEGALLWKIEVWNDLKGNIKSVEDKAKLVRTLINSSGETSPFLLRLEFNKEVKASYKAYTNYLNTLGEMKEILLDSRVTASSREISLIDMDIKRHYNWFEDLLEDKYDLVAKKLLSDNKAFLFLKDCGEHLSP